MVDLKKMKFAVIFFLSNLLTGCLGSPGISPMSDNTYSINCTGWPMSIETCYNAAHRYCPNGYKILSNEPAYVANITLMAKEMAPDRVKIRGIVVKCK